MGLAAQLGKEAARIEKRAFPAAMLERMAPAMKSLFTASKPYVQGTRLIRGAARSAAPAVFTPQGVEGLAGAASALGRSAHMAGPARSPFATARLFSGGGMQGGLQGTMNASKALGRQTGAAASAAGQAAPAAAGAFPASMGQALRGAAQAAPAAAQAAAPAARQLAPGLAGAYGRSLMKRPLTTLAGTGLGLSALNEGSARLGLPHLGGQDQWNPAVHNFQMQNTPGLGNQLGLWAQKPIQSMMSAFGQAPEAGLNDLIQWQDPQLNPGQFFIDPTTGQVQVNPQQLQGTANPALLDYLQRQQESQSLFQQLGQATGGGQSPPIGGLDLNSPPAAAGPPAGPAGSATPGPAAPAARPPAYNRLSLTNVY